MSDQKKVGRPTAYSDEFPDMLTDYFDREPYEITGGEAKANDFPTKAGFAIMIGVDRDTLKEWAKVHPEFSAAYKKAESFQEHFLVTNGLKGLVNTAFGIFTAKNVLGWRDKSEVEHSGKIDTLTDAQIDAKLAALTEGENE